MMNKSLLIGIGIFVLVALGFLFMSTMTGNVITGSVTVKNVDIDEPFRISDFGAYGDEVVAVVDLEDGA